MTLRFVETVGATTDVAITSGLHRVTEASRVDLLEQPRLQEYDGSDDLTMHGYEIATVLSRLNMPQLLNADHTQLAPEVEAAQPLYARYWLHNRGPAPLGGLPAVAHLHPQATVAQAGDEVVLRLTAASDCTDSVLHGTVKMVCPAGWKASPSSLPFVLPSGEHLEADVELTLPPDTPPGLYPIRAQLHVTGDDAVSMPASWRQVVEDVATVSVGTPGEDNEIVYLVGEPVDIDVAAGETSRIAVTVGTAAGASLSLEAHLISPWGTWEWIGPAAAGRGADTGRDRRTRIRRHPAALGAARAVVGAGSNRLRGTAALLACGEGDGPMSHSHLAATVAGLDVPVSDVDAREAKLRDAMPAAALPRAGTSEGRQLRRWLTQLLVTERVIEDEAADTGVTAEGAPTEDEVLPDDSARLEIGSIAAAALADPLARAMYAHVTAEVDITDADIADYHARNPMRFAELSVGGNGWRTAIVEAPPLNAVRSLIAEHLRGAARRRAFRLWLDSRRAELVRLAPGYEHPGDPRQPDNTHRH